MTVRAKFMLHSHVIDCWSPVQHSHTFIFRPQYDGTIPEDRRFAKATPTGELRIVVDNPAVIALWEGKQGQQFYLDLAPVSDNGAAP